ncbi:MAG: DUF4198 domain-containing protein [Gemmatimonadales bacterium]
MLVSSLLLCTATILYAHELYIKFDSYFLEPNTSVSVPILNGTFDVSENSIARDRVPDISVVSATGRAHIDTAQWVAEGDTTFLSFETGEEGTYVVGASTRFRDLGLAAADFNEYLEHDGIPDVLEARRQNDELEVDVQERYSKHVKAVVQVGDKVTRPKSWWQFWKKDELTYTTVLGYPAEIVPLVNPYAITAGDELQVRCLVDGSPVANQLVVAGQEGGRNMIQTRTDADGVATLQLDAAGNWFVRFINMVPSAVEDVDYESKWATLTFHLR